MKTRIVFLTASSGGGHDAAANALKVLITERLGNDCECILIDVYKKSLFQRLPILAKIRHHSDPLWRVFLGLTNNKPITQFIASLMRPFMIRSIGKQLPDHCDYLVAVHFNPAHCLPHLARQFKKPPKTAIVATDFDPHWAWFGSGANAIFTLSNQGHEKALESGYQKHQIYPLPLIPTERITYRKPSNSTPTRIRIGIVSGQDGSNPKHILGLLDMLASLPDAKNKDVSLFCGTNERLKKRVDSQLEQYAPLNLETVGYTKNLKSQFHHYDLMLIRTSPGILSECICAGVPVVGIDWSAHEHFQTHFIHKHKIGFSSKAITELKAYINGLFIQPSVLLSLQENVAKLRLQNDTDAMLTHLLQTGTPQDV